MATITITIPNPQVQRVLDAIADLYPIPEISPGVPQYTKAEWSREWLKRLIRRTVSRYETKQAQIAAVVAEDPTIVDVV